MKDLIYEFPNIVNDVEYVSIHKKRLESIRNNYDGMLCFCSRVIDKPIHKITLTDLINFETKRFNENKDFKKNLSFPIDHYLEKIKELQEEVLELKYMLNSGTSRRCDTCVHEKVTYFTEPCASCIKDNGKVFSNWSYNGTK